MRVFVRNLLDQLRPDHRIPPVVGPTLCRVVDTTLLFTSW